MKTDRIIDVLLCLYLLGIILTFGYASNEIARNHADPKRATEVSVVGGILAAIVWPLYLSHKAFERKP